MKKWKEFTSSEKGMIIALIVLVVAVFLSWSRIEKGVKRGNDIFFGNPAETEKVP